MSSLRPFHGQTVSGCYTATGHHISHISYTFEQPGLFGIDEGKVSSYLIVHRINVVPYFDLNSVGYFVYTCS